MRLDVSKTVLLGAILLAGVPATEGQPAMDDFAPIDKYVFVVEGEQIEQAAIYQSQTAGAFLVVAPSLASPVLIEARSATVSTVDLMKLDQRDDGSARLLPDSALASVGKFTIAGEGIRFTLQGRQAELRNKPWLLGDQDLDGMWAYSTEYRRGADAYQYSEPLVRQLRDEGRPVEVKVFFGTWCPHCQQVLPRVLRVAEELAGSTIELSFYGLPRGPGFSEDPEVQRFDIESVPTGVVLVGGREVGRIQGSGWKIPELAIKNAIQGS